jgi:hypothetical protein
LLVLLLLLLLSHGLHMILLLRRLQLVVADM